MVTRLVQLSNDVRNRVTYPGNFLEPPLRNDVLQWLGECQEVLGCADIGFGSVGFPPQRDSS